VQRDLKTRLRLGLLAAAVACAAPAGAQQNAADMEAKIRQLESAMERMNQELLQMKEQLRQAKEQAEAAAKAAAAAQQGAGPTGGTAPPTTRQQVTEALAVAQEAREQAADVQQRLDQQGVQAQFTSDGVTLQDPRGRWGVRLMGRAQLDYRGYPGSEGALADTFSVRRARLGAQATLYRDYTVQVEGEFAGSSATLTNGFLELGWFQPNARIRMGQFKPQFGLEQTLLDLQSDFQERALTQNLLDGNGLNYDRGIMVHGQPWAPMYYAVTVSNGTGVNTDEFQRTNPEARADSKDITARGVVDFARILHIPDSVIHVGYSYKTGKQANGQSATTAFAAPAFRTEARGLVFFTPEAFFGSGGTTSSEITRTLQALEASLSWKSLRLTGEYWKGNYSGNRTPTGGSLLDFDREITASYVSLLWLMSGETWSDYYANGFWQKVRPNNNFSFQSGGGKGAWELGLRYSTMDATDFNSINPAGTGRLSATAPVTQSTNKADSWTVQLKWIHNAYSRWLLSYVRTNFDTPVIANGVGLSHEDAVLFRAQVDF
jgi:phosphate-selective porin OprO/OprP